MGYPRGERAEPDRGQPRPWGGRLPRTPLCSVQDCFQGPPTKPRLSAAPTWLLPFPTSKASRGHRRVPDRRLDAAVPEISLQRAGILALVGVFEAAAMAQHVRMN